MPLASASPQYLGTSVNRLAEAVPVSSTGLSMRKDGDFEKSSPKTKQGSKVSWELELWGSEVAGGWNFQL